MEETPVQIRMLANEPPFEVAFYLEVDMGGRGASSMASQMQADRKQYMARLNASLKEAYDALKPVNHGKIPEFGPKQQRG